MTRQPKRMRYFFIVVGVLMIAISTAMLVVFGADAMTPRRGPIGLIAWPGLVVGVVAVVLNVAFLIRDSRR